MKLGSDGAINVYVSSGADVVIDVQGYYNDPDGASGSVFHSLAAPGRALDTRTATLTGDCTPGTCGRIAANGTLTVDVAGQAGFLLMVSMLSS